MSMIENPFLIYGYEGPEYFCDRENETNSVISALENGCNITVMSPRRYGKTGLIRNVFHHIERMKPEVVCFYIDIYSTHSLSDLVEVLGKNIIGKLDSSIEKAGRILTAIFKSGQITMSHDIFTGMPQFGLNFVPQNAQSTLDELFAYIRQSEKMCYIALDEFQQIGEYPEKNVEELLRTHIQGTHNAHFIFAGSKLHMMSEMFNSPRHPFYRSTERLTLNILDKDIYYDFAVKKLSVKEISMSKETFFAIYDSVDGVTWYIQAILNRLYRQKSYEVTNAIVQKVIRDIIISEEESYKRMFHMLTLVQAKLLKAIAKAGCVMEPLAGKFVHSCEIKSSSSVQRALDYLVRQEYVYRSDNGYIVYDRFFGKWLSEL